MEKDKETRHRYGIVDFERRKHPRYKVDLPVEFRRSDSAAKEGRAANASEGGLLLWLSEKMEIGQILDLRLFLSFNSGLKTIETQVEVVWMDIHLEKWGDYRTGVKFVTILPEDLEILKNFLKGLSAL